MRDVDAGVELFCLCDPCHTGLSPVASSTHKIPFNQLCKEDFLFIPFVGLSFCGVCRSVSHDLLALVVDRAKSILRMTTATITTAG